MHSARLNLRDIRGLDAAARTSRLLELVDKHKDSESWREIAQHILKVEDKANQYSILKAVLSKMKNGEKHIFKKILPTIDGMFESCQTMGAVFVLVKYILAVNDLGSSFQVETGYRAGIRKFGLFEKEIQQLQGITHTDNDTPIFNEIESAVEVTPRLYSKCKLTFELKMLKPYLSWLCLYRNKNYDYCVLLDEFCKFLVISCANANKLAAGYDIEGIGTLVVSVLDKALMAYPNSSNMALIFEHMSQLEIESAVLSYEQEFIKFTAADFIRFSTVLTRSALGPKTVKLLICLSNVFKNSSMEEKLVEIFRDFVIKKVIEWGKSTVTAQVEVQELVGFYVDGLLNNTPRKEECVKSILANFARIDHKDQFFWATLAYKIAYGTKELQEMVRKQTNIDSIITAQEFQRLKNMAWKGTFNYPSFSPSLLQPHLSGLTESHSPPQLVKLTDSSSPFFDKKNLQVPFSTQDITVSQNKPIERSSQSVIISPLLDKERILRTPQQQRQVPTSSSEGDDFLARSPQETRKVNENDNRLHKTATRFTVDSNSHTMHKMEPPIKRSKDYKIVANKLSLIPPRTTGLNTNYAEMTLMLLFALEKLPVLLNDVKDQIVGSPDTLPVLSEIHEIFSKLARFEGKTVNLKQLMEVGPSEYKGLDRKIEISQYMTSLFSTIMGELERVTSKSSLSQKFREMFEIIIRQEAACPKCKTQLRNFQNTFFLSVAGTESLETEWTSNAKFTCDSCGTDCQVPTTSKVIRYPSLMMVKPICQSLTKPRLPFPRHWNNAALVALVLSSTSTSTTPGEYSFYHRNLKNPLTWLQFTFSYHRALEMNVEDENQEFQGKTTPCLAVYQQVN